jgi:hypothetical protein
MVAQKAFFQVKSRLFGQKKVDILAEKVPFHCQYFSLKIRPHDMDCNEIFFVLFVEGKDGDSAWLEESERHVFNFWFGGQGEVQSLHVLGITRLPAHHYSRENEHFEQVKTEWDKIERFLNRKHYNRKYNYIARENVQNKQNNEQKM